MNLPVESRRESLCWTEGASPHHTEGRSHTCLHGVGYLINVLYILRNCING